MIIITSGLDITIRQEMPSDYSNVHDLVAKAFSTTHSGEDDTVQYLMGLRQKETFIPELSLVAENKEGRVVGQIVLSKTNIYMLHGVRTELLLSPISVDPDYFRQGIARSLTEEALRIAKQMGYAVVFLCGDPDFYCRLGFKPSYEYDIVHVKDDSKSATWSMLRELTDGVLKGISGTINTQ